MFFNFCNLEQEQSSLLEHFRENGYVVVRNVFSKEFMEELIPELESAIEKETVFHSKQHKDYGMLLACPVYGGKFLEVLTNERYFLPFDWLIGKSSIIWVYTSSSVPPKSVNYASRIHVDRAHFTGDFLEGVGSLILLDDFTKDNGSTWLLPGSHTSTSQPDETSFYDQSIQVIAEKGSVLYFNLRLWHAGGLNTTDKWRHALGIGMIRPYMKQRINLPLAMSNIDITSLSPFVKQKLGFFSQSPASLEEYYMNEQNKSPLQPSEWNLSGKL